MLAVIETGGKQYIVKPGMTIKLEKVAGDIGASIAFDKVMLRAEEDGSVCEVGNPYLAGATVKATVLEQARDKKIRVERYKRKVRFHKVRGHRQHFTRVKIESV